MHWIARRAYAGRPVRKSTFQLPSSEAGHAIRHQEHSSPDPNLYKPLQDLPQDASLLSMLRQVFREIRRKSNAGMARRAPNLVEEVSEIARSGRRPSKDIAENFIQDPRWRSVGAFMLGLAVEARDVLATCITCFWHMKPEFDRTGGKLMSIPTAMQNLAVLANMETDWQAMVLRSQVLSRSKLHDQAVALARRTVNVTEAQAEVASSSEQISQHKPWDVLDLIPSPWKSFLQVARNAGKKEFMREAMMCALDAQDPQLGEEIAHFNVDVVKDFNVPIYSDQWLMLKTSIVMTGENKTYPTAEAAFDVGRYYLEKDGFYPPRNQSSKSSDAMMDCQGFDWFELAAAHMPSAEAAFKAVMLPTLVLRESGLVEEGKALLLKAVDDWGEQYPNDNKYLKAMHLYVEAWCPPGAEQGHFPTALEFGKKPLWSPSANF
ncbi:MAG: hypothetical protein Q9227_003169 [Pyrenula ochraceoflavens]